MKKLTSVIAVLGIYILFIAGCGGSTLVSRELPADAEFTLDVLPETAMHGTAECVWNTAVEPTAEGYVVSVVASGAAGQTALYFDLKYDAAAVHPVAA